MKRLGMGAAGAFALLIALQWVCSACGRTPLGLYNTARLKVGLPPIPRVTVEKQNGIVHHRTEYFPYN